jgi:peptide/nickel transport system substrate-binding protein
VIAAIVLIVVIATGTFFYATQQPTTTTETTKAGLPVPNPDTFVEETSRETGSYDIAMAWDAGANYVLENVYETLVTFDGSRADKFIPWLAESWTVSSDGLVYTFHLRTGIKFQDGTPFNATAVKYTLDRTLLINAPDGPQFLLATILQRRDHRELQRFRG